MDSSDRSRDKNLLDPDHLSERIAAYTQADSWNESRRIVEQYPELLTDEADRQLSKIIAIQDDEDAIAYLEQHRAALGRCRETGIEHAFAKMTRERAESSDSSIPAEFRQGVRFARKAVDRYRDAGDRQALDAAAATWQQIWEARAFETAECSFRLAVLNDGAIVFAWRYQAEGQLKDLSIAIRCLEQTVEDTPKDSLNLPVYLNNLGNGLRARYARTGDPSDLKRAILSYERAANETPQGSTYLPGRLNNLASGLKDRYFRTGGLLDLESAIHALEQAVTESPKESPELPLYLSNLGNGLRARYTRTGALTDLKRAIEAYEQAVDRTPQSSPHLPRRLNNLSTGLHDRYNLSGELSDLEHAIHGYKEATEKAPDDSWERPGYLNNLGSALNDRYGRTGDLLDLERAIQAYEQAVKATSPSSPNLPVRLNNLATGLRDRYARLERSDDLARATKVFEESCRRGTNVALEVALQAAYNWGNWALRRRRWREAIHAYNYGLEATERLFQTQLFRASKKAWLREAQGLHARAAYALARAGDLDSAFETIERGRARLLSQVLKRESLDRARVEAQAPDVYDRYTATVHRVRFLETQELSGQPTLPAGQTLAEGFRRAYDELGAAMTAIRQLPGFERFLAAPSFDQIREAAMDAPLVYLIASPNGGLALVMLPKNSDEPTDISAIWLDDLTDDALQQQLEPWFKAYNDYKRASSAYAHVNKEADGQELPEEDRKERLQTTQETLITTRSTWLHVIDKTTRWLWDVAMHTVVETLTDFGTEQAALIPAGLLGLLPLHAAWTEAPTRSIGRRYALDEIRFSYTPNARALSAAQNIATSIAIPNSLLAVDNPDSSLDFSDEEVAAALDTFSKSQRLHLAGDDATLERVQNDLAKHDVWHFSTHGRAGWQEPLESGLLLADGEQLTLHDLLALKASARLAVLSACETGVPGTELPDELIGLPTGLLQAGVAGVVGSLWAVNDFSTALLMMRFYRCWRKEEQEPPEALRSAQLWPREVTNKKLVSYFKQSLPEFGQDKLPKDVADFGYRQSALGQANARPFSHPFYWAGFYYTGV